MPAKSHFAALDHHKNSNRTDAALFSAPLTRRDPRLLNDAMPSGVLRKGSTVVGICIHLGEREMMTSETPCNRA